MELFSGILILICAALFGITMKIADLLNEHGLKLFKGSAILFGILWGLFGALLALSNNTIAVLMLAMNIAFIIRNRLDYLNHQIAASIIIIGFLFTSVFDPILFIAFFIIFLAFGSLKDFVDDKLKKKNGALFKLNESMLYYPIPTFLYSLFYGNWIVFGAFTAFTISYDLTKYFAAKKGYN